MKLILIFAVFASTGAHLRDKAKKIYVGSAISSGHLTDDPTYKTVAAQQFDCLTAEWEMKWDPIENTKGQPWYDAAEQLMKFAKDNGMKVRGHALIWHQAVPKWVQALENNKAELQKAMVNHINSVSAHFKGRVYCWDVVNEVIGDDGSMRQSIWYKNFGTQFITDAFKLAQAADPNAKLYINDYSCEGKNKKSDALYNLVKKLKLEGVPIHGVGFQSHFQVGQVTAELQSNLQRFADLGVDVAITELDIKMAMPPTQKDLDQQRDDYQRVFNTCLAIDRCVGVSVWGFTDKYSWIPGTFPGYGAADLYDNNYKPKAAVSAIETILK